MAEKDEKGRSRRRYPSIVWPVLLIAAGAIVLLNNLGLLDVNYWELWRLWPVVLILIGLEVLLGGRSFVGNFLVVILSLALVGGIVLLLLASPDSLGLSAPAAVERIVEPLDGAEAADLYVGFAAGALELERLEDSRSLIEAELELAADQRPVWDVEWEDDGARMTLEYEEGVRFEGWNWRGRDEWRLQLSPRVALRLVVDIGAGEARVDLEGLDVTDLEVQAGTGQTTVRFPGQGSFPAQIQGGAGALILEIPEEMAARIRVDEGLRAVNASDRYQRQDGVYQTADWASNPNGVDVDVRVGVGLVTIREP